VKSFKSIDKSDYLTYNIGVMVSGITFRSAFMYSVALHFLLFFGSYYLPYQDSIQVTHATSKQLEVVYEGRLQELPKASEILKVSTVPTSEGLHQTPPIEVVSIEEKLPEFFLPKQVNKSDATGEGLEKQALKEKVLTDQVETKGALTEEEVLSGLHLSYEERPIYLAYYQSIREQISRSIRKHYPQGTQEGQVLLNFVLFSDGHLKEVVATGEKSFHYRKLKEIATRSVIEASPFPPFPKKLQRPFIPFRVMITFVSETG